MNRGQGLEILKQNIQNQNLMKHCLAVEEVMKTLADDLIFNRLLK